MILITKFPHLSWNDYYKESIEIEEEYENITYSNETKTFPAVLGNTYVYNCFFCNLTDDIGGALVYSRSASSILIEKCSFYYCSATAYTGAIRVTGGNTILAFVCGFNCSSQNSDGFDAIHSDRQRTINSVFYSSISVCHANTVYIMFHRNGNVRFESVNVSYNFAESISSLQCSPISYNEIEMKGFIEHCSISNNTAKSKICLSSTNTTEVKNSNIILNEGPYVISTSSEMTMIKCCIQGNKDTPVFSGSIKLCDCSVSTDQLKNSNINIESIGSKSFINELSFISTGKCRTTIYHNQQTKFYHESLIKFFAKFICFFSIILS